ncbi:MAG: hypothetical protein NTW31_06245 [Bacteroidetes bacterium]|nr:hypothetical protein [Bacteroidota bacterium]
MKRIMMYLIAIVVGLPSIAVLGIWCYLQFFEYKPAPIEPVPVKGKGKHLPAEKTDFSFLTWNIGYAGLGSEMDYFFDGGKTVRSGKPEMEKYLQGICRELKSNDTLDFIYIQEIDRDCKRTYRRDQQNDMEAALPGYCSAFALNYLVKFIPVPFSEPIGKVTAGLCTFSKYLPESNERHAYDAFFYWPKRLLWLKRCFLCSSYTVCGGKQLILVNLHNSAYDETGELRKKEIEILQTYLQGEYMKGNYIIIGGDWNMNPKDFNRQTINSGDKTFAIKYSLDDKFMPGWKAVYDPLLPTNRNLDAPYHKGKSGTTIMDFFVISPNVQVLNCFTADEGFANSDHNPVFAKFRLQTGPDGDKSF